MTNPSIILQFNAGLPVPKTVAELMELISELRSRKAVYATLLNHLRICYQRSDAGPAEMKMAREDLGVVPEIHIEKTVIEIEDRINIIDAQIEELQSQPFGGGTPPAAEVAQPAVQNAPTPAASTPATPAAPVPASQGSVLSVGAGQPSTSTEKKEVVSGKPKPPGGRPS